MAAGGMRAGGGRPSLRLLQGACDDDVAWSWFCGRCAAPSPGGEAPAPVARVCRACGLGLLLEARADAIPTAGDAFLVVDAGLLVQAVSRKAEHVLAVTEELAVNRRVSDLLVSANSDLSVRASFVAAVADAVATDGEPVHRFVRPWNTFGVRMRVRITACGPPRAALLVLGAPRLRRAAGLDVSRAR
jgi:hypothetical protein